MNRLVSFAWLIIVFVASSWVCTGCTSKREFSATQYTSEARHRSTMRCYTVLGKQYTPTYVQVGQEMEGVSSWYGPDFHGKQTSSGQTYNMHARTAAHKTWPMDTMVKVKNLENGKSTVVRINDRGPFKQGRIIDCSYAAGKEIGLDRMGVAKVKIEVVGFAGKVESPQAIAQNKISTKPTRIKLSNFGIQVGAFKRYAGAQSYQKRYSKGDYGCYQSVIKRFDDADGTPLYRVWLMGFDSEQEAEVFKKSHQLTGSFTVRD